MSHGSQRQRAASDTAAPFIVGEDTHAPLPMPPVTHNRVPINEFVHEVDALEDAAAHRRHRESDIVDDPTLPKTKAKRELTWWRLAMITFVFTCTGPGGLEQVVAAGGPILALVGLLVIPIIFVMPQIFVVAEMGGMMPTSAGYVVWVHRAFGRFGGFYNAWIFALTNMVDMACYPVLFGDYLAKVVYGQNPEYWPKIGFRVLGLVIGGLLSLLSAKNISSLTSVGCVLIVIFVSIMFCAGAKHIDPEYQWNYVEDPVQYSLLGSSLLWLYTGWTSIGALAGETKDSKVLPRGMTSALTVDVCMYVMALVAALTVAKRGEWEDGYFVTVFNRIIPGIGPYFGSSVVVSAMALYISALTCYSRGLWGLAEMGWAPRLLSRQFDNGAPYVSVCVHGVVAFVLLWFDFGFIVQIEYTVAAAAYILTYIAFVRLRYTEPGAPRPYKVPGGMPFAWGLTIMKVLVMGATCAFGLSNWRIACAFIGVNIAVIGGYFILRRLQPEDPHAAGSSWKQHHDEDDEGGSAPPAQIVDGGAPGMTTLARPHHHQHHNNSRPRDGATAGTPPPSVGAVDSDSAQSMSTVDSDRG